MVARRRVGDGVEPAPVRAEAGLERRQRRCPVLEVAEEQDISRSERRGQVGRRQHVALRRRPLEVGVVGRARDVAGGHHRDRTDEHGRGPSGPHTRVACAEASMAPPSRREGSQARL